MQAEKRKFPRFEGSIPLKMSTGDADLVTETVNISRCGSFCRVNKYIEPMTKLQIHLLIPQKKMNKIVTKKISCQGVVVRTEPIKGQKEFNIAVFFNNISQRDAECISDYVSVSLEKNTA